MFDNLSVRSTMLASITVPVGVLALVALWSVASGRLAVAAVCVVGAGSTAVFSHRQAGRLRSRVSMVAEAARALTDDALPALVDESARPPARASEHVDYDLDVNAATTERSSTSLLWPDDELTAVMEAVTGVTPAISRLLDRRRNDIDGQLRQIVEQLTRRTETLLNEQIACIDWLGETEQQPDRLQQLYRLDHLTHRARRSAESILVLAESAADRPRREPSPIDTVIRVAIGETKDYQRIKLAAIDQAWLSAEASFDLAHLLAELLENATVHTSETADVEVFAVQLATGDYRITLVDHGPGMSEVALTNANVLLADPPRFSIEQGETIGLTVVARLAHRLDAIVDLTATPGGGVTAEVTVPAAALVANPTGDPASADGHHASLDTALSGVTGATEGSPQADGTPDLEAVGTGNGEALHRRQRTAGAGSLDLAPRLQAADHDPAAVHAVISRYRDGLHADAASPGGKDSR